LGAEEELKTTIQSKVRGENIIEKLLTAKNDFGEVWCKWVLTAKSDWKSAFGVSGNHSTIIAVVNLNYWFSTRVRARI
jgi:hypothetical protein